MFQSMFAAVIALLAFQNEGQFQTESLVKESWIMQYDVLPPQSPTEILVSSINLLDLCIAAVCVAAIVFICVRRLVKSV